MGKSLVIVESPTKAKTIEKFLGKQFIVKASYGHVRDLPNSAAEIPSHIKKEKWSRLGIDVENEFQPLYIIPEEKKKRVADLKKSLESADELLLATDEDREGESISWHLLEVLKPKIPVKRMVFHEITDSAIKHALESPRNVDDNLVRAQETRRIIDRLYGYTVSPLLWKKMAPRLSAGRVQSVALRLLVERERERISFKSSIFWDLKATFRKLTGSGEVEAELTHVDGVRVADGKDFDPKTGQLNSTSNAVALDQERATQLREQVNNSQAKVLSVEEKPFVSKPIAPFTTSTLQQEGSRKLGFAARRTMQVAQSLYENGYITYMRTDSTTLSDEAIAAARDHIRRDFGAEYLPAEPRIYRTKVKNAQEAHEAIRPAGEAFASPAEVKAKLGIDAFKLYDLIWKRTLACQMKDAEGTRISVQIECGPGRFRASGKTISFAGFLRAYVEGADDPEAEMADKEKILPPLKESEALGVNKVEALEHQTQAPARFTEGSLIKELERLGIGRPSTWATIVDVVLSRTYAFKKGQALVPSFLAMAVIGLMERFFGTVVDYEYTASMEEDLDRISRGEASFVPYLTDFYKGASPGLQRLVADGEEKIDPRDVCGREIGKQQDGTVVEVRIGRYGPFLTNGTTRSSLPEDLAPDELNLEKAESLLQQAAKGPDSLGVHPESGKPIFFKTGRFGPYVQEGEGGEGEEKPRMASLLKGMSPDSIDLDIAVRLLSLPRNLGKHPELAEDIIAANGRFGPYIKCGSETRSLGQEFTPIDITFDQAIELLARPKTNARGGRAQPQALRELGAHPDTNAKIVVKSGRYGPYVTDGKVNATIPQGITPEEISLETAVDLINARASKVGSAPPRKKGGSKSSAAKKESKAATKKMDNEKKEAKPKTTKKASAPRKKKE